MVTNWNTLITSGAYIGEEMQAEFGRIAPAFLPIGASYLIQHQLSEAKGRDKIWLSLPHDYKMTTSQHRLLDDRGVHIFRADAHKSLGMSVFQAILEIGQDNPLEIIHGDTLVVNPAIPETDTVSVSKATEQYKWGLVEAADGRVQRVQDADSSDSISSDASILSGYFAICEPWRLLKCLVARDFSFTDALDSYAGEIGILINDDLETLDCGHLKTYYDSRRRLASARHFNSIEIENGIVVKRSSDQIKINAEANWLRTVPSDLQPFTARLIEDPSTRASGQYCTLYSSYPTLAELYLARTPEVVWSKILNSCKDYLGKASSHSVRERNSDFLWLVIGKLNERVAQYPNFLPKPDCPLTINGESVGTLSQIVEKLTEIVNNAPKRSSCVMHGDFCFSNILYDFRNDRIKLIDPRGLIADEMTVYGDIRYDIAKLGHSILGRYDQIIGERFLTGGSVADLILNIPTDPLRDWLEQSFLCSKVAGQTFDTPEIKAAIVSLFLSMVPLHGEDPIRQRALFANGLRVYGKFFMTSKKNT